MTNFDDLNSGPLGKCERLVEEIYGKGVAVSLDRHLQGWKATIWTKEGKEHTVFTTVPTKPEAVGLLLQFLKECLVPTECSRKMKSNL